VNNPLTGKVCIGHPAAKRLGVEGGSGRAHLQISRKAFYPRVRRPCRSTPSRHERRWIAVQRREEEKRQMQFFMREGSLFEDRPLRIIPERLRSNIEERVGELDVSVLAQPEIANSPPSMLTPPSPHPESRPEPSNDMGKLVTATSPQPYWMKSWLPSIAVSPREAAVVGRNHIAAVFFAAILQSVT
jgi:hypothetical protein